MLLAEPFPWSHPHPSGESILGPISASPQILWGLPPIGAAHSDLDHLPHGDSRSCLCILVPEHFPAQGVAISALAGGGNTPTLPVVNLGCIFRIAHMSIWWAVGCRARDKEAGCPFPRAVTGWWRAQLLPKAELGSCAGLAGDDRQELHAQMALHALIICQNK